MLGVLRNRMKKAILLIFVSFFMLQIVYGLDSTDSDLLAYYRLDDTGTVYDDYKYNQIPIFDMEVCSGNPTEQQPGIPSYSTYSIKFTGTTPDVLCNGTPVMYNILKSMNITIDGFTAGCWVNSTKAVGTTQRVFGNSFYGNGLAWNGWDIAIMDSGNYGIQYRSQSSGNDYVASVKTYEPNSKSFVVGRFSSTNVSIFINGSLDNYESYGVTLTQFGGFNLSVGGTWYNQAYSNEPFTGRADECFLINRSLSDEEIFDIYSNGIQDKTPPTITIIYPLSSKYYNNYDGWLNFTTSKNANCTINNTNWVKDNTLTTATEKFYRNAATLSSGNYSLNITCNDNINNQDTEILTIKIDKTNPTVTSSIQNNLSIGYNSLYFEMNFSDNNYLSNFSIMAQDFTYNLSNISTQTYKYNSTINFENYTQGLHYINVSVCDIDGYLNCNNYTYKFYKINYTLIFEDRVLESYINPIKVVINTTGIPITSSFNNLIFNGTKYSTSTSNSSTQLNFTTNLNLGLIGNLNDTITFYFNYSLNNYWFNSTGVQQLFRMYLEECGLVTQNDAFNITFKDLLNDINISVDFSSIFKVWKTIPTRHRNFTFNKTDTDNYDICIYPTWASFTADYYIYYEKVGYDDNSYVQLSSTIDNETNVLSLYMTTTTNTSAITINVIDQYSNGLANYVVEAYQYNVPDNDFTLVATEVTDESGVVILDLITGNTKYKFIVRNSEGVAVYTSSTFQLYQTSYSFVIQEAITTVLDGILLEFTYDLNFPKDTPPLYNITLTWNDISDIIYTTCLEVKNTTINYTLTMYDTCSQSNSGTLSYFINVTQGYYIAKAYVYSSIDGNLYVIDSDSIQLRPEYEVYGSDSVIYAGIFVGTMAFLGLGVASISATGGVISIILLIFGSIMMQLMGFMNISIGTTMMFVIVAIVVIMLISKENR